MTSVDQDGAVEVGERPDRYAPCPGCGRVWRKGSARGRALHVRFCSLLPPPVAIEQPPTTVATIEAVNARIAIARASGMLGAVDRAPRRGSPMGRAEKSGLAEELAATARAAHVLSERLLALAGRLLEQAEKEEARCGQ